VPTPDASPYGIASGPDGNLWFTEGFKIGRLTTGAPATPVPTLSDWMFVVLGFGLASLGVGLLRRS